MNEAIEKVIKWAIPLLVLVLILIFINQNLLKLGLSLPFLNNELTQSEIEIRNTALDNFNGLKNSFDKCSQRRNQDCFCSKDNILFPTDYRLELEATEVIKLKIKLLSNTKETIKETIIDISGCVILSKGDELRPLNEPLTMRYGAKNTFSFLDKSDMEFDSSLVFYKQDNKLCILKKDVAEEFSSNSLC